jgi:pyochelin synthetase
VAGQLAPSESGRPVVGRQGPVTELQQRLAELWASVLRCEVDALDVDSNFYAAAGDSLAAARVLTAVRKQFGVGMTLDRFFEVDTIRAMAAQIELALTELPAARRAGA